MLKQDARRPFYLSIVDIINNCNGNQHSEILTILKIINSTEITNNHDNIVQAINKLKKRCKMTSVEKAATILKIQSTIQGIKHQQNLFLK